MISQKPAHRANQSDEETGLRKFMSHYGPFVAGMLIVMSVVLLYSNTRSPYHPKAYYTVDDGKTFFVDDLQIPPIQHHGQEAVRAMVYSCDGGKTKFVGYLMRFTPEARPKAAAALKAGAPASNEGLQVKRPGDAEWVMGFDPRNLNAKNARQMMQGGGARHFSDITDVKCPEGKAHPVLNNPQ